MSLSTLTAFDYIAENSLATPGLFNRIFSQLSDNIGTLNEAVTNPGILSGSTWASIGLTANSSNSDYIRMVDSSGQRSTYIIGSHAGGTADGLNIYDESGTTMLASFSKQSIRFYQNVVGPVFDVGGALASTLNAATFGTGADSKETRIQAAILAASNQGMARVYVPASMYPYSASSVSFIYTIQMVREGGNWRDWDVKAYGAAGDNAQDDTAACESAISSIPTQGGEVFFPPGIYKTTRSLSRPGGSIGPVRFRGAGITEIAEDGLGATTVRYSGSGAGIRVGTNDSGFTVPQGQGFHLADMKVDCTGDAHGIKIDDVSGVLVSQVLFQGFGAPGISTKVGIYCNELQSAAFDEVRVFQFSTGIDLITQCYDVTFKNCLIDFNDVNVKIGSTSAVASVRFLGGVIQRPTTYDVDVVRGAGIVFLGTYFESNGSGKQCFRVGATSGVTVEGLTIIGGTMEGADTTDSLYAIEVQRCNGLTVEGVSWDNFTNGFINNLGNEVSNIVLLNNRQLTGSRGATTLTSSYSGVRFAVPQGASVLAVADTGAALTARTLGATASIVLDSTSGSATDGSSLNYQKGSLSKWIAGYQVTGSSGQYEIYDTVGGRIALRLATGIGGAGLYTGAFTAELPSGTGLTSRTTGATATILVDSTSASAGDGSSIGFQKASVTKWFTGYQVVGSSGQYEIYDVVGSRVALQIATGATGAATFTGNVVSSKTFSGGEFWGSGFSGLASIGTLSYVSSSRTVMGAEVWTSGISVGNSTAGGTVIPAISSTSSKIAAFVVQGSASSFTIVTWAAAQPGDQILSTIQPDAAVSSMSSGLVLHSHCTKAGQIEVRLSNVSTLAQNQSSKTFYFTRLSPF